MSNASRVTPRRIADRWLGLVAQRRVASVASPRALVTVKPPGTASFVAVLPVLSQLWRIRLGARHRIGGDLVMTWRRTGRLQRRSGRSRLLKLSASAALRIPARAIVIVMGTSWLGSLFGFFCATVGDGRSRLIMQSRSGCAFGRRVGCPNRCVVEMHSQKGG